MLFLDILDSGVHIVSLANGRKYEAGKIDDADLIASIVDLSRAHEESVMKSDRIGAAWERKRQDAANKKLTKWCPQWLRLSGDRNNYEVIEDRASVVRRIFSR